MAEFETDQPAIGGRPRARDEWRQYAGPGAPGEVKSRYRIAVSGCVLAAALGPPDHREEANAALVQPRAFLAGRERDVSLRPLPGPVVLVAIKPSRTHPVLECQIEGIVNAESA